MEPDDRMRAIAAEPDFQMAVIAAARGDVTHLASMDAEHLRHATRSLSVLVAGRLARTVPCMVAGFTFWVEHDVVTFRVDDPTGDPRLGMTVARMLAVDASALRAHAHDREAHNTWLALWVAVPASSHRALAFLLGGKFTTEPTRVGETREAH